MRNVKLNYLWEIPKSKDEYVVFQEHHCYELVYYGSGCGRTTIEGKAYRFVQGDFVVIPPHSVHDEFFEEDGYVICLGFQDKLGGYPLFSKDSVGVIRKIMKELLHEIRHCEYGYQDMISAKLNELSLRIFRNENHVTGEKNLEYIVNYLTENYMNKIVFADCAKQLHISYSYFNHKFRECVGVSPQRFLLSRRLDVAKDLLINSPQLSCTEIAYRTGFSSSAQFSALFRREFGASPLRYRKERSVGDPKWQTN